MDKRDQNSDWAKEVPQEGKNKDQYEDYGWEKGESVLPEFRDPSVHETPSEQQSMGEQGQQNQETTKGAGKPQRTASEVF